MCRKIINMSVLIYAHIPEPLKICMNVLYTYTCTHAHAYMRT